MLTSPLGEDPAQAFASHLIHVFRPPEGKPAIKYALHCTQSCTHAHSTTQQEETRNVDPLPGNIDALYGITVIIITICAFCAIWCTRCQCRDMAAKPNCFACPRLQQLEVAWGHLFYNWSKRTIIIPTSCLCPINLLSTELGVLASRWRISLSLLPDDSMSPFQASAPLMK